MLLLLLIARPQAQRYWVVQMEEAEDEQGFLENETPQDMPQCLNNKNTPPPGVDPHTHAQPTNQPHPPLHRSVSPLNLKWGKSLLFLRAAGPKRLFLFQFSRCRTPSTGKELRGEPVVLELISGSVPSRPMLLRTRR
ncbi:hypothetical protein Q8A73_021729 [Channa argus]|nr:hypothetical protein Q8A73_021729 [Channa argus]